VSALRVFAPRSTGKRLLEQARINCAHVRSLILTALFAKIGTIGTMEICEWGRAKRNPPKLIDTCY
jgi:hypothetical protein